MLWYNFTLSVRTITKYYWCPTEAWLSIYGPKLYWDPPHFPQVVEDYEPMLDQAIGRAQNILSEHTTVLKEPLLYSHVLKVKGRPDLLGISKDRITIIELKARRPLPGDPSLLQAALYSLIGRHHYNLPVESLIVYPTGKYRVKREDEDFARKILYNARRVLAKHIPPRPIRHPKACRSCIFKHICPYRGGNG